MKCESTKDALVRNLKEMAHELGYILVEKEIAKKLAKALESVKNSLEENEEKKVEC